MQKKTFDIEKSSARSLTNFAFTRIYLYTFTHYGVPSLRKLTGSGAGKELIDGERNMTLVWPEQTALDHEDSARANDAISSFVERDRHLNDTINREANERDGFEALCFLSFAPESNKPARTVCDTTRFRSDLLPELCFAFSNEQPGGWETKRIIDGAGKEKISHTVDGELSEEWLIQRGADNKITSVEPLVGRDPQPDKQNLSEARRVLIERIDKSKLDEPDKIRLFQTMQQLEQNAREGKLGEEIDLVRTDLASTYLHTALLLKEQVTVPDVIESLRLNSKNTVKQFLDCAGNFAEDGKRADTTLDDGKPREARDNEIWSAKQTSLDGKSLTSFSLNGREIESWRLTFKDKAIAKVEQILHPDPRPDSVGLDQSRTKLAAAVQNSEMSPVDKLEFFKNMAHMEHRARQGDMGREIAQVRKELSETYNQLGRLLDGRRQSKVALKDRVVIARQLAHQFADTMDIDQGMVSDACRITTSECRLSVRRPSVVARIVADTAIDGSTTIGKINIKLDDESLKPASEFATRFPRPQEERSYASQLFQLVSMNLLGTDPTVVKEHIYFTNLDETKPRLPNYDRLLFQQRREGKRNDKGELYKKDNGMVIYGQRNGRVEQLTRSGELQEGTNQILLQGCMVQRLLDMLDPGKHANSVLAHRDVDLYNRERLNGEANNDARGLVLYSNEQELEALIATAKREGRLPLIIATRTHDPDPGEPAPNLQHNESNHVITIRDYIPSNGREKAKIVTDDQFGRNYDRRNITVSQLYNITAPGS